jgi:predicted nucleic acid-binding protein
VIVLDTNVVSELYRAVPDRAVIAWMDSQPSQSLFLCTPVLAELRYGMERLENGSRKDRLQTTIDQFEKHTYRDRVLAFDHAGAAAYGRIVAARRRAGRPMETMDALIAAIATANGAAIATRNIKDFIGIDVALINPFDAMVR